MSRLAGYGGSVSVGGSTVAGIRAWNLDYTVATAEGTGFDSDGNKEFKPTLKEWAGNFEGHKDGAPLSIGSEVALILNESDTANQNWSGQAIITGIHPSVTLENLVAYTYDFQGTGALTPASA